MTRDKTPPGKKSFLQKLTSPHPSIENSAERRFATVLATLLLALLPLYFLPEGIRAIIEKHDIADILYYGGGAVILSIAYLFARSPYPRMGARITMLYFMLIPFATLVVQSERYAGENAKNALIWSVPIMLMALVLLRPDQTKFVVVANIGIYLLIPTLWSGLTYEQVFSTLWVIIATGGLMMVSAYVQNRYLKNLAREIEQSKINERRFREIFLGSPIALWEADFSQIKKRLDTLSLEHGTDLMTYMLEHPEIMQGAASSVILLDANEAAKELYAADDVKALQENLHKIINEKAMFTLRDSVINLWQGIRNRPIETIHKTLGGIEKNVVVRFSIRSGHENNWERINISISDMSEQRAAESSIRQLASAVDASGSSIVITDIDGNIEYTNPAFSQVTGYTKEEALGENPRVLKSGQHPDEFYQEMWETLSLGKTWQGEIINKKKNGDLYWEHASISPVKNDDGKTLSYVAVKDDITKTKKAEHQATQLLQEQIAVRKAMEAITSTLDFDTVLNRIATEMGLAIDATSAYIWLWDAETHSGTNFAEYFGVNATDAERIPSLRKTYTGNEPKFILSLEENKYSVAYVENTYITEKHKKHMQEHDVKSALYIPIHVRGKAVAFAEIWDSREKREFEPSEIVLCQHIAQNAAVAIDNAHNYQQAENEIQQRKEAESELRKLSNAADQAASAILITDTQGIIEYVNPAFSTITGYTVEEAIGKDTSLLKSGKHLPEFYTELWQKIAGGEIWRGELINRRKDGSFYWESQVIAPVRDTTDNIITHYVAVKDDITKTKQAEAELRNLSSATEQTASAIVIANLKGHIEYVNPAFTVITGYTLEDVAGKTLNIQRSDEHDKTFYEKLDATILRGIIWKGEIINKRKDGSLYWESQVISPIKDDTGKITHFVYVKEDVTRRKELEQSLAIAHEEALVASDMKTQLLANVSHDMRTPLGAILGYTEMLDAGVFKPLNDEQANATRAIAASSQKLLDFVNNLLSQAQIDTGKIIINETPYTPQKLLENLGGEISLAKTQGITVETKLAENLPTKILCDPYWLGQIFHNLLSNAIKFTPAGGKINILLAKSGESAWKLDVEDNGVGIPPEAQSYIFESFRQVDGSPTRKAHTGSGLGLSIVNHLVKLMRGEIRLESKVGKGSKFTVLLPLKEKKE